VLLERCLLHASSRAIPSEDHVPNEEPGPCFIMADFGSM